MSLFVVVVQFEPREFKVETDGVALGKEAGTFWKRSRLWMSE